MTAETITQRVEALRAWMRDHNLVAFIFPSTDPHASEYVPDHWKTREWISGFNGSAGTAVVTLTSAALWTDSRYWLAAEEQTAGTPFQVIRCTRNVATGQELARWIADSIIADSRTHRGVYDLETCMEVGMDAWTNTGESVSELRAALLALAPSMDFQELLGCKGLILSLRTDCDPAAELWTDRPPLPEAPIILHPLELAGRSAREKLDDIRAAAFHGGARALLVSQLDEIAWALNLRGTDVHCTPVFVSYLIILPESAVLYVNPTKVTPEVRAYLDELHVSIRPYHLIAEDLNRAVWQERQITILAETSTINDAILNTEATIVPGTSPIPALRAIKNDVEQAGFRQAMLRDGVAMVKFLRWLDRPTPNPSLTDGGRPVTELSIDRKLTALRAEQPGFRDISFDTIAGYGPHAAIVHYEATPETDIPLQPRGLLLLDSGAQYDCGTTDITRTIALGPLTDDERRDYTLVLKGHIRLATAVFPDGTSGTQLDVLARYAMWQEHKNYGHGTGHGVGSYLSVHEGPHQFRMNYVPAPLHAGMTITIEPGIYIAGSHGVRIENTMLIVEDGDGWLRLDPLTLCPIDVRPIVLQMMEPDELAYLNNYHARVREALLPLLDDEADRAWLRSSTEPLTL